MPTLLQSIMSFPSKCREVNQALPTFVFDTSSLTKLGTGKGKQDNLVVYTVLTFLIVLSLYYWTKDWKGVTAPEEVDLGSMSTPQQILHQQRRKPHHLSQRARYREYSEDY